MSSYKLGLKCALEALEDRQLLTVSTTLLSGGILQITGDNSAEEVRIMQNDVDDTLSVSWNHVSDSPLMIPMPAEVFQSSAIQRIVVKLGAGNDDLVYTLDRNQLNTAKTISMDLGQGDDHMLLDLGGYLVVASDNPGPSDIDGDGELDYPMDYPMSMPAELNASLAIDVQGGTGTDTIDAIFGHISRNLVYRAAGGSGNDIMSVQSAGVIATGANVRYDLNGGAGHDTLAVDFGDYGVAADARVTVLQQGGLGNDLINFHAHMPMNGTLHLFQLGGAGHDTTVATAQMTWMSTGRLVSRVLGDAGNDQMTLKIKRDPIPPYVALFAPLEEMKVDALMSGGSGRNQGWATRNVRVFLSKITRV